MVWPKDDGIGRVSSFIGIDKSISPFFFITAKEQQASSFVHHRLLAGILAAALEGGYCNFS